MRGPSAFRGSGFSGTTSDHLNIRKDGFSFGALTVETDAVQISSIFKATHLTVSLTDFGVTYGQAVDFSGSVGVTATSATLTFGSLSASVTDGPDHSGIGLSATFQFSNNQFAGLWSPAPMPTSRLALSSISLRWA